MMARDPFHLENPVVSFANQVLAFHPENPANSWPAVFVDFQGGNFRGETLRYFCAMLQRI
jgi:hypothetical protein